MGRRYAYLPRATNNEAEYAALEAKCNALEVEEAILRSQSEELGHLTSNLLPAGGSSWLALCSLFYCQQKKKNDAVWLGLFWNPHPDPNNNPKPKQSLHPTDLR